MHDCSKVDQWSKANAPPPPLPALRGAPTVLGGWAWIHRWWVQSGFSFSLEMNPRKLQEVKSLGSCKSGTQDPSLWFQNLSHHGCPSIFAQNWEVKELKKPSATFFTLCLLHKT